MGVGREANCSLKSILVKEKLLRIIIIPAMLRGFLYKYYYTKYFPWTDTGTFHSNDGGVLVSAARQLEFKPNNWSWGLNSKDCPFKAAACREEKKDNHLCLLSWEHWQDIKRRTFLTKNGSEVVRQLKSIPSLHAKHPPRPPVVSSAGLSALLRFFSSLVFPLHVSPFSLVPYHLPSLIPVCLLLLPSSIPSSLITALIKATESPPTQQVSGYWTDTVVWRPNYAFRRHFPKAYLKYRGTQAQQSRIFGFPPIWSLLMPTDQLILPAFLWQWLLEWFTSALGKFEWDCNIGWSCRDLKMIGYRCCPPLSKFWFMQSFSNRFTFLMFFNVSLCIVFILVVCLPSTFSVFGQKPPSSTYHQLKWVWKFRGDKKMVRTLM